MSGKEVGNMQREALDPQWMSHSSFKWRTCTRRQRWPQRAADLARFVATEMPGPNGELAGRGVLAPETLARMSKPLFPLQTGVAQGLGQSIVTIPDRSKVLQHWGGNTGWQGYIAANPKWGVWFVTLTNSDNGGPLNFETMLSLLILLFIGKTRWILIPVLVLAFLICAVNLNKSLVLIGSSGSEGKRK